MSWGRAALLVALGCGGSSGDECVYPESCPEASPCELATTFGDSGPSDCPDDSISVSCEWNTGPDGKGTDHCATAEELEGMKEACDAAPGCDHGISHDQDHHRFACGNARCG